VARGRLDCDDENCFEHGDGRDLQWAAMLEPSHDGMYWCAAGSHYVRVTKELLVHALQVLMVLDDSVPA
jgi:hypothetical protein